MPEHRFSAEKLEIRILYPPVAQRLVREIVHVLENEQPGHQPCWQRRLAWTEATHRTERFARKSQLISAAGRTRGETRVVIASRDVRNKSSCRSSRGWLKAFLRQRIRRQKNHKTPKSGIQKRKKTETKP